MPESCSGTLIWLSDAELRWADTPVQWCRGWDEYNDVGWWLFVRQVSLNLSPVQFFFFSLHAFGRSCSLIEAVCAASCPRPSAGATTARWFAGCLRSAPPPCPCDITEIERSQWVTSVLTEGSGSKAAKDTTNTPSAYSEPVWCRKGLHWLAARLVSKVCVSMWLCVFSVLCFSERQLFIYMFTSARTETDVSVSF